MYNHAPDEYECLFCLFLQGQETKSSQLRQTDIVERTPDVTAFMAVRKWANNQGHVLIIPNEHFENIYDLPSSVASKIHSVSQKIALAMKSEYECDGLMLRQHNEPAGGQHVWHYHLHIIPRYRNDNFGNTPKVHFPTNERAEFALKLRNGLKKQAEIASLET